MTGFDLLDQVLEASRQRCKARARVEVLLQRRRELWASVDALTHDGSIDDLERMLDEKARLIGLVLDNDKQFQIAEALVQLHTWTIDAYNKSVCDARAREESAARAAFARQRANQNIARIAEHEERYRRREEQREERRRKARQRYEDRKRRKPATQPAPVNGFEPCRFVKTKHPTVWPDPEYPVPIVEAEAVEVTIPQLSVEVDGRAHGLLQWSPWARRRRYEGRNRRYEGFSKAWVSSGYSR